MSGEPNQDIKFLVVICREGETEVTPFEDEIEARQYFEDASQQWSDSYFLSSTCRNEMKLNAKDKVYVASEKRPYTVRAADDRFAVCTKPHFSTVRYFIVDLVEGVRGTENLIFSAGAETDEDCQEMLQRLNGIGTDFGATEVSHRNRVPLDIIRVVNSQ